MFTCWPLLGQNNKGQNLDALSLTVWQLFQLDLCCIGWAEESHNHTQKPTMQQNEPNKKNQSWHVRWKHEKELYL